MDEYRAKKRVFVMEPHKEYGAALIQKMWTDW